MITKIHTNHMSREDWLEYRKRGIGGSEMSAILGMSKWSSPYSVWAEKLGFTAAREASEAMRQGTDLEEYVAQRFSEKSGLKVQRKNAFIMNDNYPHIFGNIDRKICGQNAGLECKTTSPYNQNLFTPGEFPRQYYAQCVTYLAVTEYERWYLAVLIFGTDFKVYQLTTIADDTCPIWCDASLYVDKSEFAALKDAAEGFWHYVETETPPPVDGLDCTKSAIDDFLSATGRTDETTDLTPIRGKIAEYLRLDRDIKNITTEKKQVEQEIILELNGSIYGNCGDTKVSYKPSKRRTFSKDLLKKKYPNIDISDCYTESESNRFAVKEEK